MSRVRIPPNPLLQSTLNLILSILHLVKRISRHSFARRLAFAALIIAAIFHIDEVLVASGNAGFLPVQDRTTRTLLLEGPTTILSIFSVIIWRRPSFIVSLSLLIIGVLITADEVTIGTRYLSLLSAPAPVVGLFLGLVILVLGAMKMLQFVSAIRTPAAGRNEQMK